MINFKVGDTVKVIEKLASTDTPYMNKCYKISRIQKAYLEYYDFYLEGIDSDYPFSKDQLELVESAKQIKSGKPTIIHVAGVKIVFNYPYTIVTTGRFTGKAKCNPEDQWDAEIGLQLAAERYEEIKQDYFDSLIIEE